MHTKQCTGSIIIYVHNALHYYNYNYYYIAHDSTASCWLSCRFCNFDFRMLDRELSCCLTCPRVSVSSFCVTDQSACNFSFCLCISAVRDSSLFCISRYLPSFAAVRCFTRVWFVRRIFNAYI